MNRVLAIDPGNDTGWAKYQDGTLVACGLGKPPDDPHVSHVLIERPQVYPGTPAKEANDLITLAIDAGRHAEWWEHRFGARVEFVLPTRWKGQIPKDVHHRRVIQKLRPEEARVAAAALEPLPNGKRHNVLDAVGLGLYAVGRRA